MLTLYTIIGLCVLAGLFWLGYCLYAFVQSRKALERWASQEGFQLWSCTPHFQREVIAPGFFWLRFSLSYKVCVKSADDEFRYAWVHMGNYPFDLLKDNWRVAWVEDDGEHSPN